MFVDWLSIWQEFPDWTGPDFLGGRVVSVDGACGLGHRDVIDGETGEVKRAWALTPVDATGFDDGSDDDGDGVSIEFDTAKFGQHRGSFETTIQIRFVNRKLEVRGNPSAWARIDNLFGYTLDDAIEVYNGILRDLCLPEFTQGDVVQHWLQEDQRWLKKYSGAHLTRVDVTQNIAVGCGKVADYHKWVAAQKVYRTAPDDERLAQFSRWDWSTVYSSESKYWITHKHYDKSLALEERTLPEYQKKLKKASKEGRLSKAEARQLDLEAQDYLGKLAEWCAELGISRSELSFRNRWFAQQEGLGFWMPGETEGRLFDIARENMGKLWQRAVVHQEEEYENLTSAEYTALDRWRKGMDVKSMMARATFYRVRASVLEKTGYDLAARPVNVEAVERRVIYFQVRPLALVDAPVWYQRPVFPEFRLAA